MVQQIKVLVPPVELPGGSGQITTVNAVVNLTDDDVAMISPTAFTAQPVDAHNPGGSAILQNLGFVGQGSGPVSVQAAFVAQDGALTSSQNSTTNATVGADGTTAATLANALKVSYNALQTDVAALRTTVNNLLTALQVTGAAQKSS